MIESALEQGRRKNLVAPLDAIGIICLAAEMAELVDAYV